MSQNVSSLTISQLDDYIDRVFKAPSRVKLAKEHVRAYPGKCFFIPTRAKKLSVPCDETPLEHGFCEKHVATGYSHAPVEWEKMTKLINVKEAPIEKEAPVEKEASTEKEYVSINEEPDELPQEIAQETQSDEVSSEVPSEEVSSDELSEISSDEEESSDEEVSSDEEESSDEEVSSEEKESSDEVSSDEKESSDEDDPEDIADISSGSESDSEFIPTKVRRNRFGNYEHADTHFVFDIATHTVYGSQKKDGSVKSLDSKDIKLCTKNGWNYFVPSRIYKKD